MMTPIILYDLIIGLSFGLQVFTSAYILTGGGSTAAGSRQLAPDLRLLSLQAGLPVRPDGLRGRPVGRDVRRQRPPRGGRLPLGAQLGVLRRRGSVDGDDDGPDRSPTPRHRGRVEAPAQAGPHPHALDHPADRPHRCRSPVHHPVLLDVRQRAQVECRAHRLPAEPGPRRLGLAELRRRGQLHPVRAVCPQLADHHGRHHDRIASCRTRSSRTASRGSSGPAGT